MPSAARVQWAKMRVAITTVVALAILGVLVWLLLGGSLFEPKVQLRTYINDATGVDKNIAVRLDGILIGKVAKVSLLHTNDRNRVVEVQMELAERYLSSIPEDSTTDLGSEDMFGTKFIDVNRGKSARPIRPGSELPFRPAPAMLANADITVMQQRLRGIDATLREIEEGRNPLGQFFRGEDMYNDTRHSLAEIEAAVRRAGRSVRDQSELPQISEPLARIDRQLAEIQKMPLVRESATYEQIRSQIRSIGDSVAHAAKSDFIARDDLYVSMTRQIERAIESVDRFNTSPMLATAEVYESLNGSMRELRDSVRDFRENPKKYLWLKIF